MRKSLVNFWAAQRRTGIGWCHTDDHRLLVNRSHCFNLEFPVSPYVGNVLAARVIVLGANAGYNPITTPQEFVDESATNEYLSRVAFPDSANWARLHEYYSGTNYGCYIPTGQLALVNACAYRSPSISQELDNRALISDLPSCRFTRQWLLDEIVPLAKREEVVVIAKRYGLWDIRHLQGVVGVVFDPAPVSPQLAKRTLAMVKEFLDVS